MTLHSLHHPIFFRFEMTYRKWFPIWLDYNSYWYCRLFLQSTWIRYSISCNPKHRFIGIEFLQRCLRWLGLGSRLLLRRGGCRHRIIELCSPIALSPSVVILHISIYNYSKEYLVCWVVCIILLILVLLIWVLLGWISFLLTTTYRRVKSLIIHFFLWQSIKY